MLGRLRSSPPAPGTCGFRGPRPRPRLVSLRSFASRQAFATLRPWSCSAASEPSGFLGSSGSRHASPAASRWSPFATPQALPAPLRFASGLAPFASEPPAASPHAFFLSFPRKQESVAPSRWPHLSFPRKRESRESDLPPPLLFHNTVSPSTFTIAEQCHSDGVLPASARQNDEESLHGLDNRKVIFRPE